MNAVAETAVPGWGLCYSFSLCFTTRVMTEEASGLGFRGYSSEAGPLSWKRGSAHGWLRERVWCFKKCRWSRSVWDGQVGGAAGPREGGLVSREQWGPGKGFCCQNGMFDPLWVLGGKGLRVCVLTSCRTISGC